MLYHFVCYISLKKFALSDLEEKYVDDHDNHYSNPLGVQRATKSIVMQCISVVL